MIRFRLRVFLAAVLAATMGLSLAAPVLAQQVAPTVAPSMAAPTVARPAAPARQLVAGRDYQLLASPLPTTPGRLDVIYFFWYGSPWSQSFDPLIRRWADDRAPALIRFQPSPVVLADGWGYGARVFFALEQMGIEHATGPALMRAISQGVVQYADPSTLNEWLSTNGVDTKAFSKAINSPLTVAKTSSSPSVTRLYAIQRVPAVVIDGRYVFTINAAGDTAELMDRVAFATEALAQRKAAEMRLTSPASTPSQKK